MKNFSELCLIVFSKDRTFQLDAYLTTVLQNSDIGEEEIYVLYKKSDAIPYRNIELRYPGVNFIQESSLLTDIIEILKRNYKFVMFGCDDVLINRKFSKIHVMKSLDAERNAFVFSLRLGKNICGASKVNFELEEKGVLKWDWRDQEGNGAWGYPWELSASVYRSGDVLKLFSDLGVEKITPNFLENILHNLRLLKIPAKFMLSFDKSKSIIVQVNRVQDDFKNDFDSLFSTDVVALHRLFLAGVKLDFDRIYNKQNSYTHGGCDFFLFKGWRGFTQAIFYYPLRISNRVVRIALSLWKKRHNGMFFREKLRLFSGDQK